MAYQTLLDAIKILTAARLQQNPLSSHNPAWVMLYHASEHLARQADAELRGKEA